MNSTCQVNINAVEQNPLICKDFIGPNKNINIERFKYFPNFLIVRGTGRNVGKTLSACNIISNMAKDHDVVGIKISPHFHELDECLKIIHGSNEFVIVEENMISGKDSSRMRQAGAKIVFYVQAKNEQLMNVIDFLTGLINPFSPVVVESGGLYDFIEPGLLLNVIGEDPGKNIIVRENSKAVFLPSSEVSGFGWNSFQFVNGKFIFHA